MGKFVYLGKLPEFLDGKNLSWVSISQDEKVTPTLSQVSGLKITNQHNALACKSHCKHA